MIPWGCVPIGAVLPFPAASYGKTNGESITLTGLAVTDVEIYKGTTVTQRSSDAGVALIDTDGIDIDGITGIHGFSIDTGDNTDAGFFAVGSYYYVIVAGVTIDGQTVNFIAGTFSLRAAESVAGVIEVDVTHIGGTAVTAAAGIPEVKVASVANNAITAAAAAADFGAEIADAVWDEALSGHQTIATAGRALILAGVPIAETTAAGTPSTTAVDLTAGSTTDDFYKDHTFVIINGSGAGQTRIISNYIGATRTCEFDEALGTAPAAGDAVFIKADHVHPVSDIQSGLATAASIAALNDLSAAAVNAEVVDALATDTYAEPGQGAPAATTTLAAKINYLYKMMRNKKDQTATLFQLYADDGTTVDQKSTVSNDGTTAVRGELAAGP